MEKRSILWLALMAISAIVSVTFARLGWTEEGVREIVRVSAQVGVLLFSLTFAASSLRVFWRSAFSAWALRNRRYTGLSFAAFHFLHLSALVALGLYFPEPFVADLSWLTLVAGGIAYSLLLAQTVTSNDAAVKRLGRVRWTRLHTAGSYVIWGIFLQSYLPRALEDAFYIPFSALLVVAIGLRIARRVRVRRKQALPA